MFPSQPVTGRSVLDFSLLFAMVVYAIVGIALHAAVLWLAGKIAEIQRRERHRQLAARVAASPATRSPAASSYTEASEQVGRAYPLS